MVRITRTVLETPGADDDLRFGGANALSEFYLGHRLSADLDFFAMAPERLHDVSWQLPALLRSSGLVADVKTIRTGRDFHRFVVEPIGGGRELQLDVGRWFPPQIEPPVTVDGIRVESYLELGVGKLLALLDRGEAKDAIDLWAMCTLGGADLGQLVAAVSIKDPGLAEAPHTIARRLEEVGNELPGPIPALLRPADTDEVQRWFANEAQTMWRRLGRDAAERS